MITLDEAKQIALSYLNSHLKADANPKEQIIIPEAGITEKSYGWIINYQSKGWVETGDIAYFIFGTHPIVVEADSGDIYSLPGPLRHPNDGRFNFDEAVRLLDYLKTGEPSIVCPLCGEVMLRGVREDGLLYMRCPNNDNGAAYQRAPSKLPE